MSLHMNPGIRAQWCAALRSGEYKRGTGRLHQFDDRFCCLGVLCDLAAKEGVVQRDQAARHTMYRYDGEAHYLPDAVMYWAGLASANPRLTNGRTLAAMNDDGRSFAEIANAIDGGQS